MRSFVFYDGNSRVGGIKINIDYGILNFIFVISSGGFVVSKV